MLSPGLLSLKKTNSGNDFLFSACDFLQASGTITTLTENGCVLTSLEEKSLYVDKKGIFEGKSKILSAEYINETIYISTDTLIQLGYQVSVDTTEMVIQISHSSGLPIDKKNALLSENVIGKTRETKMSSTRENLSFNRFQLEGYTSPSRKGSAIEGDFDVATGEFIFKQCDEICLSYINWKKTWKKKGHKFDLYLGYYDLFYFPGKWQRLKSAAIVEVNKKATKQRFSLDYAATTDYFIYRNGILVRRGRGSIKDIEIDLSEENYFSQYTVKVIDRNGRIQTFDLYNGLGLLDPGDYSLTGGYDSTRYTFINGQIGLIKNFNVMGGVVNSPTDEKKHITKRAKFSLKHLRFEAGELTDQFNNAENYYEQGELSYSNLAYIYNRRKDILEERDNTQHTALFTPNGALLQIQHRIRDKNFFENEYLFGKQIFEYFLYLRYVKYSDNNERQGINVSGARDNLNYDIGTYQYLKQIGYFALLSGMKKKWRFTGNLDTRPGLTSLTSRIDWIHFNKNIYSTIKHQLGTTEVGLGFVYSFFPVHYNLDLKKHAQSLVMMEIFLDQNGNGIRDVEDKPLNGIQGTLISKNNRRQTDASGKMYFEIDSSYTSVIFSFDEGSFKEMHYLPPKENIRLEISPRKVNNFQIPIKINGIMLLNCSTEEVVKNLRIEKDDKTLHSYSTCSTPIVLDQLAPGEYILRYSKNKKIRKRKIHIDKKRHYFRDINLD